MSIQSYYLVAKVIEKCCNKQHQHSADNSIATMMTTTQRLLLQVLVFAFCLLSVIAVSGASATRELSSKKRARLRGQRDSQTQDGEPPARNLLQGDILLEAASSNERELLGMIGNTETHNHIMHKPPGKGEKTRIVVHPLDIQERQGGEEDLETTPIDASEPEATSSDQEEEVEFEEETARKEKSNKKDKGKDDNEEEEEEEKAEEVVEDEDDEEEEEEEYEIETEDIVGDKVDGNGEEDVAEEQQQEQQPEQKGMGKKDEIAIAEPEEEAELPEDDQGENSTVEDVSLSGKLDRCVASFL
jgi:hypothetical protein